MRHRKNIVDRFDNNFKPNFQEQGSVTRVYIIQLWLSTDIMSTDIIVVT